MTNRVIGIIGAGGHADEVRASSAASIEFNAVTKEYIGEHAFIDIDDPGKYIDHPVHVAIGAPFVRKSMVERWPGHKFESIISPSALIDASSEIGAGTYVGPSAVVTTNVIIGKHVIINVGALVHHNCKIDDFVTISPGVAIGGWVTIGKGVFIGIGASIVNDVKIAPGVVIGAGAAVVNDLDIENGVYVGVPAKLVKTNEAWLSEI